MNFTQWRMARRYGNTRALIADIVASFYERLWYCTIRRNHQVKMQSYGHCIRCGKLVD